MFQLLHMLLQRLQVPTCIIMINTFATTTTTTTITTITITAAPTCTTFKCTSTGTDTPAIPENTTTFDYLHCQGNMYYHYYH